MKKIIIISCLSIAYANIGAQNTAWMLPPSATYKTVTPFSEGYSVVQKDGKYYFLDKQMRLSSDPYLYAYPISQGFALVQETRLGQHLNAHLWRFRQSEFKYIGGEYEDGQSFKNGLAAVKYKGAWGFINREGAKTIECRYESVRPFNANWTGAILKRDNYIINYLNSLLAVPYAFVHEYSENLAAVESPKGDFGYIDTLRHPQIPITSGRKYAGAFSEGLAAVSDTVPHLSYIDPTGQVRFWYKNGTKKGAAKGHDLTETAIENLHTFSEGMAAVQQFGKWGFINPNGMIVIPFDYDEVTRFSEGVAAVKQNGQWHYLNKAGYTVKKGDEDPFLEAQPCSEQVAWVRTRKGWGVLAMSEKLEIVVSAPFRNGGNNLQRTVKAHLSSHRVLKNAIWKLNGQVVQSELLTGNLFETDIAALLPFREGKNRLELIVQNNLNEKTNECIIYCKPTDNKQIQYQAVLIANNDYDDSNTWESLKTDQDVLGNPIAGADSLANVLHEQYQFQQIFIAHNATLAQMQSTLNDLTQQSDSMVRTLFFYAGHGDFDSTRKQAYMVPVDARERDHRTHLSASYLVQKVRSMSLQHFLTVIDACYGGSFVLDVPTESMRGSSVGKKKAVDSIQSDRRNPIALPIEPSERLKSRWCIASGHRTEVPNTSDFIIALLKQLIENQDVKYRVGTLFDRFKTHFVTNAPIPQYGVLPNAGSDGGDFIFRRQPNETILVNKQQ